MNIPVKVVVFHVDVPKEEEIKDEFIDSSDFIIKTESGVKSTWEIYCNLNDERKSSVGIFLDYKGSLPSEVFYSFHLISCNEFLAPSEKFSSSKTGDWLKKAKGWGHVDTIISQKQLLDNSEAYFITERRIRFVVKIYLHENPPDKISSSTEDLKCLYESMKFSDVIIKSFDNEEFKAHKAILAISSEVLEKKMSNNAKSVPEVIEVKYQSAVVKELIRFIYCKVYFNESDIKIEEIDVSLYHAAEEYKIEGLKNVCLISIYKRLDVDNALGILTFAKSFKLEKLYSCCLLMIYANYASFSLTDDWIKFENKQILLDEIARRAGKLTSMTWTSDDF